MNDEHNTGQVVGDPLLYSQYRWRSRHDVLQRQRKTVGGRMIKESQQQQHSDILVVVCTVCLAIAHSQEHRIRSDIQRQERCQNSLNVGGGNT